MLATVSLLAVTMAAPGAVAQVAAGEGASLEEVVVTGSRIVRDGYTAPTPVSVVGAAEIEAQAPANLADFVNTLPAIAGSSTPASTSASLSGGLAGINAVNLRNLGINRTLVLVDGQRSVVSTSTGVVDINTIPQSLVQRVDIVTGGASAAYGSDAVGGVINFILNRDYQGLKFKAEYGETTYGDGENYKFSLTAGQRFLDGKLRVLASAEYARTEGIHDIPRAWNEVGFFGIRNPAYVAGNGQPEFYAGYNIGPAQTAPGGLITQGPASVLGKYFGPVNPTTGFATVNNLAFGQRLGQWMIGGDWQYTGSNYFGSGSLLPGEIRDSLFGRVEYEVSDNIQVFAQASYNKFIGLNYYITHANINNVRLQADNAYLPPEIRSQLPAGSSIVIGTSNFGWPTWGANNERAVTRMVAGAKGKFNAFERDWNWDAYVQRGQAKANEELINTYSNYRLAQAQDAVVAPAGNAAGIPAGRIVCRSTLASPTNGCVPLNRLGTVGALTPEAFKYIVYDNAYRKQEITQTVAALTLSGDIFDLPAGAVAVAFGAEAREEKIDGFVPPEFGPAGTIVTSDPACVTNPAGLTRGTDGKPIPCTNQGWEAGNYLANKGKYTVQEGFIELEAPIIEGLAINGAGRYTHYSTSGGVFTWKVGSTWQVIPDVKLRGTLSRDIRAPNLDELFAAGTGRSNAVTINNTSFAYVQFATGNPDLKPEVADSYNIGAVITPQFAPGLTFAIDYYKIGIKDAIGSLVPQDVADLCYLEGNAAQCANIIGPRVGGGGVTALPVSISRINLKPFNFAKQDLSGIDLEATYRTELDQFLQGAAGTLTLRGMVTHYIENVTDRGITGSFARDDAGSRSQPDWNYRLMANYAVDMWNFNLVARGISSGKVDNSYVECASACPASTAEHRTINDNRLPGAWWIDTAISRDFEVAGKKAQLQFAIRNLLDKDPPNTVHQHLPSESSASTAAFPQTLRIYDQLGRTFKISIEIEM